VGPELTLLVGIGVPNYGQAPSEVGLVLIARAVEDAGFDSVSVTDHVIVPDRIASAYPYSTDGAFFLPPRTGYHEALVTLAALAAATDRVGLEVGVCVAALRDPRLLASQLATIDRLSGGRVVFGVGVGWLREEFEAFEVPFAGRGDRLDAVVDVLRQCWTGSPAAGTYGPFTLPAGLRTEPTPVRPIPVLVGGETTRALRRVAERGDGWFGAVGDGELRPDELAPIRKTLAAACERIGRNPATVSLGLRVGLTRRRLESGNLAEALQRFVDQGVSRLILDVAWRSFEDGRAALGQIAEIRTTLPEPAGGWWTR
jgi:probable F420-dependent oxidoreductase